jgi:hypothetical protein
MRLIVSGLAGVVAACLIFALVVMAPLSTLDTILGLPKLPHGWPSNPLNVQVFVSNLTEPLGVGSEGEVAVIISSTKNASDVSVTIEVTSPSIPPSWPLGITVVEGDLSTWVGNLNANISVIFNARIRAVEAGYARIWVSATWYPGSPEGFAHKASDSIWILIQENNIQISHEPITPPGVIVAEPGNGTLPVWPNGTIPVL